MPIALLAGADSTGNGTWDPGSAQNLGSLKPLPFLLLHQKQLFLRFYGGYSQAFDKDGPSPWPQDSPMLPLPQLVHSFLHVHH